MHTRTHGPDSCGKRTFPFIVITGFKGDAASRVQKRQPLKYDFKFNFVKLGCPHHQDDTKKISPEKGAPKRLDLLTGVLYRGILEGAHSQRPGFYF
jgi:hypothetical protein